MKLWMLAALLTLCGVATAQAQDVSYVERSWDETNKVVTSTTKTLNEGEYTLISGSNTSDEGWMPLYNGWYVVKSSYTNYKVLNVMGDDVHLVLCDGAKLTVLHVKLESGKKLSIYGQGGNTGHLIAQNDDVTFSVAAGFEGTKCIKNAAGIGGGDDASCGTLVIHGGYISASGAEYAAGIGGGKNKGFAPILRDGSFTMYGGKVFASGGDHAAGIGSGSDCSEGYAGYVSIYGGECNLYGGDFGAAIGGGENSNGAITNIYGGEVYCDYIHVWGGASIGGGYCGNGVQTYIYGGYVKASGTIGGGYNLYGTSGAGNGGIIEISGGTVEALGKQSGAAIGCGYQGKNATIKITGGTVYATTEGNSLAAGIGGGGTGSATLGITISGGTVTAKGYHGIGAGGYKNNDTATEFSYMGTFSITGGKVYAKAEGTRTARAIGGSNIDDFVSDKMTLYDEAMVSVGSDENSTALVTATTRKTACATNMYAAIEPCTHVGSTYTVTGTTSEDTHTQHCAYCTTVFTAEKHTLGIDGRCSVCGVEQAICDVTIYLPKKVEGEYPDGQYESRVYQMIANEEFDMPGSPVTINGMEFSGWLVGVATNNSFIPTSGETLLQEGDIYKVTGNTTFTARYNYLDISLANDGDNNRKTLIKYNGMTARTVTLTDRTLYKDGSWNTLCLPFDLTIAGSVLDGATVKTLESTSLNESTGTLTLTFGDAVSSIEAGKPYIVKWTSGGDIENPVFSGVTISSINPTSVATSYTDFTGTYSPYSISGENKTMLYLGGNNKLYYPNGAMTIGACRAYFQLNGITAGEPTSTDARSISNFVLNFGNDETTEIKNIGQFDKKSDVWYDLQGRKIVKPSNGKMPKGLYIYNGKKIVIQ